ncbi:hypothetical protein ILYODFUR_018026 [Ilyodon furcidens]|uniref:Uncharacterized protein n=1 Tax=Ilyodon furcidens TaxID=33524 RepID=A0ABV0UVV5_9TELE
MDVSATENPDCCRGLYSTVQWTVPTLSSADWSRTLRGEMMTEHKMAHLHFVYFHCPTKWRAIFLLFFFFFTLTYPKDIHGVLYVFCVCVLQFKWQSTKTDLKDQLRVFLWPAGVELCSFKKKKKKKGYSLTWKMFLTVHAAYSFSVWWSLSTVQSFNPQHTRCQIRADMSGALTSEPEVFTAS